MFCTIAAAPGGSSEPPEALPGTGKGSALLTVIPILLGVLLDQCLCKLDMFTSTLGALCRRLHQELRKYSGVEVSGMPHVPASPQGLTWLLAAPHVYLLHRSNYTREAASCAKCSQDGLLDYFTPLCFLWRAPSH